MNRRTSTSTIAALVLALVAGLTATIARAAQADVVHIGAIYPTHDSPIDEAGVEEYRGVQMAVDLANQQGGVHGKRVQLDLIPTETPDAATAAVETLHRRGTDLVVGTYNSTLSKPAAEAAHERGMLLWENGAVGLQTSAAGGGSSFFRISPMGQNLGINAIEFVQGALLPKLGVTRSLRYAVVYVDDVYGRAVADGALDTITSQRLAFAGRFPYDPATVNMTDLVTHIGATHPDVLMVVSYLEDGESLRRATLAAHLPLVASIGTSSSFCSTDFGRDLGTQALGLFASDKPAAADVRDDTLTAQARSLKHWAMDTWQRRHHEAMQAHTLSGFSNTWALLHNVLPASASLRPRDVAAAALSTKLDFGALPNGSGLDIAAPGTANAGSNRRAVSVIWEWVGVGRRAVVWPPQFATAPIATFGTPA